METKLQTTFDIGGGFLRDLKETINQLFIANGNVTASIESLKVDLRKVMKIINNVNQENEHRKKEMKSLEERMQTENQVYRIHEQSFTT